jgi:hypothetical protein
MLKHVFVAATALSIAVPATAQTVVQAQQVPAPAAQSDVNKLICKREEEIGSRLASKKVCLTLQQWQERQAADREQTERVQYGAQGPHSG